MGWTIGNFYLTLEQMQGNALEAYKYFSERGWSLNAISGMSEICSRSHNSIPGSGRVWTTEIILWDMDW